MLCNKVFSLLLFAFGTIVTQTLFCQQSEINKKSVYTSSLSIEVAGHSRSLFSANYEKIYAIVPDFLFSTLRCGFGYTPPLQIGSKTRKGIISTPLVYSLLAGKKNHFAQLGIGYTSSFGHKFIDSTTTPPTIYQKFESALIISLGYRYINKNGLTAQIFPLAQWTNNSSSTFAFGFGISVGKFF